MFRVGRAFSHGAIVTRAAPLTIVHSFLPLGVVVEEEAERNRLLPARPRALCVVLAGLSDGLSVRPQAKPEARLYRPAIEHLGRHAAHPAPLGAAEDERQPDLVQRLRRLSEGRDRREGRRQVAPARRRRCEGTDYRVDLILALCEGPVSSAGFVWKDQGLFASWYVQSARRRPGPSAMDLDRAVLPRPGRRLFRHRLLAAAWSGNMGTTPTIGNLDFEVFGNMAGSSERPGRRPSCGDLRLPYPSALRRRLRRRVDRPVDLVRRRRVVCRPIAARSALPSRR